MLRFPSVLYQWKIDAKVVLSPYCGRKLMPMIRHPLPTGRHMPPETLPSSWLFDESRHQ